ncbi:hypothetical protein QG37_04438 [Candidozyma auris]|uniref:Uncharacterized protein n=1 Tax=Candidozyma auris TaxID=498019 RepID=A0A0L0NX38_CANAR|nr:hypothetical protein QG37_04438 [[Candida] auris]
MYVDVDVVVMQFNRKKKKRKKNQCKDDKVVNGCWMKGEA